MHIDKGSSSKPGTTCSRVLRPPSLHAPLQIMSALAGGIVFGSFLCHITPGAFEAFTDYWDSIADDSPVKEKLEGFPMGPALTGAGFILLVLVDRVIVSRGLDGHGHGHAHAHGHGHGEGAAHASTAKHHDHVSAAFKQLQAKHKAEEQEGGAVVAGGAAVTATIPASISISAPLAAVTAREGEGAEEHEHGSLQHEADSPRKTGAGSAPGTPSLTGGKTTQYGSSSLAVPASPTLPRSDGESVSLLSTSDELTLTPQDPQAKAQARARAWVFFLALSLHSIMDGLSIGGERDLPGFSSMVTAVVGHKIFDGIALGIPVFLSDMPWRTALAALTFCAFTTPLGIGIGLWATQAVTLSASHLAEGCILGVAGGSFLFISTQELLPASLADGRLVGLKLLCFTLGWAAMVVLAAYV